MFCPKCGKKNEDSSLFCTWCGAGFSTISTQSLSAAPEQPVAAVVQPAEEKVLQTVPAAEVEPIEPDNSSVPVSASMSAEPTEPTESAEPESPAQSLPAPGVIPQSGIGTAPDKVEVTNFSDVTVPVSFEKPKAKEPRSYTAAHLAICLVVAGVMAAAAGVFAGLYFSTIL